MPPVTLEVIAHQDNRPVIDIINAADHRAALQTIGGRVQALTSEGMPPLHASVAGGRKTMSAILSIAMNVYGRQQDKLSHILVDPEVERQQDFLCPSPDGTDANKIHLVDLRFPSLGTILSRDMRQKPLEELTEIIARQLSHLEPVVLRRRSRELWIGDRCVKLRPIGVAIYLYLAKAGETQESGVNPQQLDFAMMAQCYREAGATPEMSERLCLRLQNENPQGWFLEHLSRLKGSLVKCLGPVLADEVGIVAIGKRPHTRYRLRLPASRIAIED